MPSVFTAFVRSQRGAEMPDAELLHDAWSGLQAALVAELKRRGLWHSPPCYLGVDGYERWEAEGTAGDPMSPLGSCRRPPQSALAELVTDCWDFVFSKRLQGLRLQLGRKENIDGLVFRSVKNFLYERQREHDPVGFRIFARLKAALAHAVARGALHVLGGDARIRNNTVFGFAADAELRLPAVDLAPIVAHWNDELLPALVTAKGRREAEVLAWLERLLLELPGRGIPCFRFKDLIDPLKRDARQRWAAYLASEDIGATIEHAADQVQALRQMVPERAIESRESFEHLTRCVSASITRLEIDPRTRVHLATLWHYLKLQCGEGDGREGDLARDGVGEGPLSHRELSRRLQIPRDRLPGLFETLKGIVAGCSAPAGRGAAGPSRPLAGAGVRRRQSI